MKMYEISQDIKALQDLFDSAVDENGEPRELNDDEKAYLNDCALKSEDDFNSKFDSYCKFMANLKADADAADGERKALKSELDRLSSRAKAMSNRREAVKSWLFYNMQILGIEKHKTSLFSANTQATPMAIKCVSILKDIPECFLKPRELNTTAIKEAIKTGSIKVVDNELFYEGVCLDGVLAETSKILVIR